MQKISELKLEIRPGIDECRILRKTFRIVAEVMVPEYADPGVLREAERVLNNHVFREIYGDLQRKVMDRLGKYIHEARNVDICAVMDLQDDISEMFQDL